MLKISCYLFLLLLINGNVAPAQQTGETAVFPFGIIEKIYSKELREDRTLNIYLPSGYHPDSTKTYPVIYLLDGSANEDYPHIAGLVQFMTLYALIPPSIVVGIANVDRYRDFTTPTTVKAEKERLPTSGGSAAFIGFIENELQPFIAGKYRVSDTSTIIGQSLGGLLAAEILFYHSHLFGQYIIVSPSFWWNKGIMLEDAQKALEKNNPSSKKIYIAVGNEPGEMITGAQQLEDNIKKHTALNEVVYEFFPRETHATVLHRSVYQALEWLYTTKK